MLKNIGLLLLGLVIGALGAAAVIRASRNPDSLFFALRVKAGQTPTNTSEADWLERHYGPERQSMNDEETKRPVCSFQGARLHRRPSSRHRAAAQNRRSKCPPWHWTTSCPLRES